MRLFAVCVLALTVLALGACRGSVDEVKVKVDTPTASGEAGVEGVGIEIDAPPPKEAPAEGEPEARLLDQAQTAVVEAAAPAVRSIHERAGPPRSARLARMVEQYHGRHGARDERFCLEPSVRPKGRRSKFI